ncbi:MAG: CBS domain-containing protein [Actinomycetota bacterium]|nr:CBS domain-containing protein [Actinomycetota bacterium]
MTGFRFLRIRGIPVEANWSWVLLFGGIILLVMARLGRPELDSPTLLGMAIACAVVYFVSILLHELGHALWALREGWQVDRITLYGLGGIAWLRRGPYWSSRAYFRVVAAGPLVTAALVVLFGGIERVGEVLGFPSAVVEVAGLLAFLQLVMLVFNLMPAFPLDGGQMMLAWLWRGSRDPGAAARTAMRAGLLSACLALAAGMLLLVSGTLFVGYVVTGAGVQLLFLVSVFSPPTAAATQARPEVVGDLIRQRQVSIPVDGSVQDLLDQVASARGLGTRALAVTRDGELVGYTSMGLVRQVAEERESPTVAEAMVRRDEAIQLDPNTPLEEALEQLPDVRDRAIVVEDGKVTGIVLRRAIANALLEAAQARRQ